MSHDTFMSFYLSSFRLHIFRKTIQDLGNPRFVRFMVKEDGKSFIIESYHKKDFHSHRVKIGNDTHRGMDINSMPLCMLLKNRLGWEDGKSYRVPGKSYPSQRIAVFDLTAAQQIHVDEKV